MLIVAGQGAPQDSASNADRFLSMDCNLLILPDESSQEE